MCSWERESLCTWYTGGEAYGSRLEALVGGTMNCLSWKLLWKLPDSMRGGVEEGGL